MDEPEKEHPSRHFPAPFTWVAITFVLLLVFGNGAYWKWKEDEMTTRQSQLDDVLKLNTLEQQESEIYHSIVGLSEEYIKARDDYSKAPTDALLRRFTTFETRLVLLKTQLTNLERKLAKLEHREPRSLTLDLVPPSAPTALRVVPQ